MRLLLDTQVLLWWLAGEARLPSRAKAMIADGANDVLVSSISIWEVAIKTQTGKLTADVEAVRAASLASGLEPLPFTLDHAAEVALLPPLHRDPFDRALVAQARREPAYLLTVDELLAPYGDQVMVVREGT